jgi:hypothetical protein
VFRAPEGATARSAITVIASITKHSIFFIVAPERRNRRAVDFSAANIARRLSQVAGAQGVPTMAVTR